MIDGFLIGFISFLCDIDFLKLETKGSLILWKCFNLLSPIYHELNVFSVKRNTFLSNVDKISPVILVVLAK